MRSIPNPLYLRYLYLGLFTLAFLALSLLSVHPFFRMAFLKSFEVPFIYLFMLFAALYLVFEVHNIRQAGNRRYTMFKYDRKGIYRDGYLLATWDSIVSVSINTGRIVRHVRRQDETSGNRFMTASPLDNLMLENHRDELTVTLKEARIYVQRKDFHGGNSVVIRTTPNRQVLRRIMKGMQRASHSVAQDVVFDMGTLDDREAA